MLDKARETWIVIAAFNEAPRVAHVVSSLTKAGWSVVVVDDGSVDDTATIARSNGAVVLRHVINRGQGAAIQTGLEYCVSIGAKYIVTFDADGQHRASDIPALLEPLRSGTADIVLGSRFLGETIGMPLHRRCLLKAAVLFTRLTTRLQVTDTHNGLRAMTSATASKIHLREDRMAHASEILHLIASLKLRYVEHPVTIQYRQETLAKGQRSSDALRVFSRLVISRLFT
jgi:polyprenyl-phospho-N-acetylgalactosaminyl synthase